MPIAVGHDAFNLIVRRTQMRKYPELYVEWTPASGISGQDFQITVPGLAPSGEAYITEFLPHHHDKWRGFVPLWNKDGKVWSSDHGTDNVTVSIASIKAVDNNAFVSEVASSVLHVEDLKWVPDAPEEIRPSLSPFLVEVDDSFMAEMEITIQQNISS